jgi:hypothetical protein
MLDRKKNYEGATGCRTKAVSKRSIAYCGLNKKIEE